MTITTTCYRHPNRVTGASCTRCGRHICPDCMVEAPVGHHCPECVRQDNKAIRRVRPVTGDAIVTKVLIALNVVVFLLQQGNTQLTDRFSMYPDGVAGGEYYRFFTAAFLHISIMHILFNMLSLWIVGPTLESVLGKSRYLILYFVSAAGGSLCSYFLDPRNGSGIGASGAVFGLFGAYFIVARARKVDSRQIAGLIIINLVIGFVVPGIDVWAHIGGLLAGGALGAAFLASERLDRSSRLIADVTSVALVVVAMVVLTSVRTAQLTV